MNSANTQEKKWQRPTLTPHRAGGLNKFGANRYEAVRDAIDGVPVTELVKEYGSPLFVFSERRLRENVHRVKRAFSARYPNVIQGWSYKTNYIGAVCNILHQEGAWAEVVSDFEYEKARSLGVPGEFILFNGPNKNRKILTRAVAEGAKLHIDHLDELALLEEVAKESGKVVPVTIRLNFDTGYTEAWSRFGFNIESGQALEAAQRIAQSEHLKLTGLHSHVGTFVTELRAYTSQVRIMCAFMESVEAATDCLIEYIDIGGGFASHNALQGVYLPPEEIVPSAEQYAEAICDTLLEATNQREAQGKNRPTLVLESGRALVDDAEELITSVVANKRLPDGRRSVVVDAGINLLFTAFWYNHSLKPTRYLDGVPEETVVYGPMCMNIDVVRQSIMLPPLPTGEPLVIGPVGAYNNTQWMQFIEYRPNVVMVNEQGGVDLIRAAENLEVVTQQERMPEHLSQPFPESLPSTL